MNQNPPAEISKKMQGLQVLEQHLQQHALQKQATQVELNEIQNALTEVSKTKDEVYRVVGGIMLRANVPALTSDLSEKKRILELRLQAVEKQEQLLENKAHKLRDELNAVIKKSKAVK
jgi:prefoldin beta subunit